MKTKGLESKDLTETSMLMRYHQLLKTFISNNRSSPSPQAPPHLVLVYILENDLPYKGKISPPPLSLCFKRKKKQIPASAQSPSNLYGMLPQFGVCNMKPISSKVISEFHLCKDEIVFKLASQYGIDSVPRLLVDFFCHARAFSKIHPPHMRISLTITSGTPLTLMNRTKSKIFIAISFEVVAIHRYGYKRAQKRNGATLMVS